ncbi:hypothetical protein ACERCG_04805 [Mannheimia sp. E30BD]|uniref:hypothetical protein n=1 Tax=Mannheimia sp. E30BD TaxID=3278708 RepID=UPI00359ECC6D
MAQSAASDLADNIPFVHRQGNYTRAEHAKQYQPNSYFVDKLPYTEFLDEQKMLLLEDVVQLEQSMN